MEVDHAARRIRLPRETPAGAGLSPAGSGRGRQRDARLVLGRRPLPPARGGDRAGARATSRRARRSWTSAASPRARARRGSPRRRSWRASSRSWSTSRACPVSVDTSKAAVARRALELGAVHGQRRHRPARRPRAGGRRRRLGRLRLPHAHARRAADDAGRPALRGRRLRGEGVPRGAARVRRRGRDPRGARSASIPASASGRPWSTTSSCSRGSTSSSAIGRPVLVGASRKRFLGRLLGDGRNHRAGRAPGSPSRCSPSSAGRRSSASTTSASTSRRSTAARAVVAR